MGYATPADLAVFGVASAALSGFTDDQKQAAINAASSVADGYLRSRFQLPLTGTPTTDLTRAVCAIAVFDLLTTGGFNPEVGSDDVLRTRYKDAISWLRDIADGRVTPLLSDSSASSPTPRAPLVLSQPSRGWYGNGCS